METQTIAECDIKPVGIVEQLLEIAEKYDCMSEIGNATSWRWKEGIISRMPKTKTVAKILKAAFRSEKPIDWYQNTTGELKHYVKHNYGLQSFNSFLEAECIDDIYDSLIILLIGSNEGRTYEELLESFCFFRYASTIDELDYFIKPDELKLYEYFSEWASKKLDLALSKVPYFKVKGKFKIESTNFISSEKHTENIMKLQELRLKVVGFNSHFDMWRFNSIDLTDAEHIELEREILKIYQDFRMKSVTKIEERRKMGHETRKTRPRVYGFSANTLPIGREEWLCDI